MLGFGKAKEEKKNSKPEREYTYEEFAAAEAELKALKEEYGIEDNKKQGKVSRAVSSMFERAANREPVAVSKKKYVVLALLTGWFGGHRFYAKHYKTGLLYLAFCWLGLGLYHTVLDILQVIPMKPDENGMILM